MQYKYAADANYEDFASGRVIRHKTGGTNFPVRLAQEIFCRCVYNSEAKNNLCLYDPCCGGGYLLTAIGLLNYSLIQSIIASDCDTDAVLITEQNLRLLTAEGINERISHLHHLHVQYGKPSHSQAIESAEKLNGYIDKTRSINVTTFRADILHAGALTDMGFKADIVFTDIPYDNLTAWNNDGGATDFTENLLPVLHPHSVVAVCSNKQQKITADCFTRLEKQKIGKRKFEIFKPREGFL
ncbi:MAG: hypothetical protein FWD90_12325 [Defluviitaleaceae bacterium]|nr:hypothetical protein [Defluviitaleaceae bacterium]